MDLIVEERLNRPFDTLAGDDLVRAVGRQVVLVAVILAAILGVLVVDSVLVALWVKGIIT